VSLARRRGGAALLAAAALAAAAAGAQPLPLPTTSDDFRLPGTQPLTVVHDFATPEACASCHAGYGEPAVEPLRNWQGSMMAQSGRDPVTWAAIAVANQDAAGAGETCLRCHLPKGWLEGRSAAADGTLMTADDRHGVQCSVCHRLVDPFGGPGAPPEDADILADLAEPVTALASAMMVVDPLDRRRGPFDVVAELGSDPHLPGAETRVSPFHQSAALCGTCHNVRNPVFTKNPVSGRFEANAFDAPADPSLGFPEQTTYDEWAASEYAAAGVYAPQFGGNREIVSTCQDCHMPRVSGRDAKTGLLREDLPLHDMTGGNTFVPEILPHHPVFGAEVDAEVLQEGKRRAVEMLRRAATLSLALEDGALRVRVTNESGHKLPTGYPEGRRMWLHVRALDRSRRVVFESGRYVFETATLVSDPHLRVWETLHGLDEEHAAAVGLPAGKSFHLVLNNVVLKDNRIPPRGFTNAAFAAFDGAPVGAAYEDGQHWDEASYPVGPDAAAAEATLWYQTASREYVEFLRDENATNAAGFLLYDLWEAHGKSEPVAMARGYVEARPRFAESCRRSVAKAQAGHLGAYAAAWSACFEAEGRGFTCDAAGRDAALAAAEAALRDALGGAKDAQCAGAGLAPSSLGHGTSCPVPCARTELFDFADVAECGACLAGALADAALAAAWGAEPPVLPDTTPAAARACRARLAKAAERLAARWTKALAKCEAKARAQGAPADCADDPAVARALDRARRDVARCESFAGLPGCAQAGDADAVLACFEDALAAPVAGYVGLAHP